ncbi:MAG: fasciclin domain-containing protein [candidate division SR1 bacterium]|nr:fasciclin domain-containing protein [candidate division SR1 bacterium]
MSFIKKISTLSLLGTLAITGLTSVSSYAQNTNTKSSSYTKSSFRRLNRLNIVDRIAYYDDMSTLVTAVSTAGLIDTLRGGDFTILTPSNDAFAKLPAGTLETLIKPENKTTLTNILLYHVIPGKVNLAKLEDGSKIKTVLGQELTLLNHEGMLQVTTQAGKTYDLSDSFYKQTNGNIYRLDEVLIPS